MTNAQKAAAYTLLAAVAMVCATVAAIEVPTDRWEKLGRWLSDPATATVLAGLVVAVGGALGRLRHSPAPALVAAFIAAATLTGCGASALQTSAVGVTVALRAEEAVTAAVVADLDRQMEACPAEPAAHNACVDAARASVADLTTALDSLEVSIRAVGAAIATAADVDAGQPLPEIVVSLIRDVLSLWDQVEVIMRARGIDVPREIDLVVAALSALVPA